MKRWLPSSILGAQLLSHLSLVVVVSGVLAVYVVSVARQGLEDEVGRKLQDIARIASRDVPFARLELIRPGAEATRMVRRLNQKLDAVMRASGAAAIEVCDARGALLLSTVEAPIGSACAQAPSIQERARLKEGRAVSTGSFTEGAGRFMTAFAPVRSAEGSLFAVVQVRADAAEVEVLVAMGRRLYLAAGVTVLLGAALSLLLAGRIARPIRQAARTADRIGGGQYAARVELPATRELRVLARSLNVMAAQVESRDRKLKAIAGTVAHEIRNPLNSMNLLVTLLEEELRDAGHGQSEIIDTLQAEIAKLDRVLTDFLTWSRPVSLTADAVDARGPASRAVQMAEAPAQDAGVRVELAEGEAAATRMDPQRMERCLLNLILNAVQASPAESRVEVEVKAVEGGVEYRVMDRGPGLSEEARAHLFEPFFTTRTQGTGLGLANARAIVQAHGGTLEHQDREGGGTCALLRLPRGEA